jgi:lysylphosphatidylglycerol synthetase-like protein (DUF2156 family)
MCWRLSIILSLKYLGCKDRLVLYLIFLLVIKELHHMQRLYLSISQPFITVSSMVMLLPHLDRSMRGIVVVLLNNLKFIKEFLKNSSFSSSFSCNWRYFLLYVGYALSTKIFYLAFHSKKEVVSRRQTRT